MDSDFKRFDIQDVFADDTNCILQCTRHLRY
jgi:hypothetical protein